MAFDDTSTPSDYYRTASLLRAKHDLARAHAQRDFAAWALALLPLEPGARVLDAGCGWGRLTWTLVDQFANAGHAITCADRSVGMVQSVAVEARRRGLDVHVCAAGIEALPFAPQSFDLVIAAHVLYHLEDIPAALGELARMMRPGARLLATTNSEAIRPLIIELHEPALDTLGIPYRSEASSPFSLENAAPCLQACFAVVRRHDFEDTAIYSSPAEFRALYQTLGRYDDVMRRADVPDEAKRELAPTFEGLAEEVAGGEGALRTPILMGAFACSQPR